MNVIESDLRVTLFAMQRCNFRAVWDAQGIGVLVHGITEATLRDVFSFAAERIQQRQYEIFDPQI